MSESPAKRRPRRVNQNESLTRAEGHTHGVRIADGLTFESEQGLCDALPPLLRQYINESIYEWTARGVTDALNAMRRQRYGLWVTPTAEQEAALAVEIVLYLNSKEEEMRAAREAEIAAALA